MSSVTCPSPLWNGENGFSIPFERRIDSTIPLDPAVEVGVDLPRLPALGRAAERVADGRAGEAPGGPVGELVSVHVISSVVLVGWRPGRPARPAGREMLIV